MKKIALVLIIICMALTVGCINGDGEFLRIHIRANSDDSLDQEIKLVTRDLVVEYLKPLLSNVSSAKGAEKVILANTEDLESKIDLLLYKAGYKYSAKVTIGDEYFGKSTYGDLTLEEGVYRAVIVKLGKAVGKNWWCVAYPPLCFSGANDYDKIKYKSYFYEIFNKE